MKLPKPVDEPPGPPWMRTKEKERTKTAVSFSTATRLSHRLVFNFLQPNGGKRSGSTYPTKTEEERGDRAHIRA